MTNPYQTNATKRSRCDSPPRPKNQCSYRGLTSIEVLASASVLAILISSIATLGLRIRKLDRDVQFEALMIQELANCLEREIASPKQRSADAPSEEQSSIPPSELILSRWPDASIVPIYSNDALGQRITLQLFRTKELGTHPYELTGWVIKPSNETQTPSPISPTAPESAPESATRGTQL